MTVPSPRVATTADLPGVLALYRQLRPDDPPLEPALAAARWAEVNDGQRSIVVVAEADGELAATCMLAMMANLASGGRRIGLVEHVITAERFRRRGLARQVLAFALDRAWAADCCKVMLLSGAARAEAHRVYASLGFDGDVERGFVVKAPARLD